MMSRTVFALISALFVLDAMVSGVRLTPSIGTTQLAQGDVKYLNGKLFNEATTTHKLDEDISMGDLPNRPVSTPTPRDLNERAASLRGEGWVSDKLRGIDTPHAAMPDQTLAELGNLAVTKTATVNDGVDGGASADPRLIDPADLNHKWKPINNYAPSQDDPVRPNAVPYGIGNVAENAQLIYKDYAAHHEGGSNGKSRVVKGDPAGLARPPVELVQPVYSAHTDDIAVEVRGEDTDTLGEPVRGWEGLTRGPHDTRGTRVLDPTIPKKSLSKQGGDAAVDDADGHTGANETGNMKTFPRPLEREPQPLSRNPFREGMEEHKY